MIVKINRCDSLISLGLFQLILFTGNTQL